MRKGVLDLCILRIIIAQQQRRRILLDRASAFDRQRLGWDQRAWEPRNAWQRPERPEALPPV